LTDQRSTVQQRVILGKEIDSPGGWGLERVC